MGTEITLLQAHTSYLSFPLSNTLLIHPYSKALIVPEVTPEALFTLSAESI